MSENKANSQNQAEAPADEPKNAAAPASQAEPAAENTGAKTQAAPAEDQVAAAKKEAADNYDRYVRAVADLENFRRRTLREKDELRQYAASRVLEDMFPIIEAVALGLDAAKKPGTEIASVIEGMDMVLNQIKSTLGKHGLKEINPAPGAKFDPHQEDAIAMQPSADIADGHVLQVFRVGYTLNGRVLRPASVVVSSGKPDEKNGPAQSED
ncbi:molecular chaperone GrpE [Ereboglobus sp. PH5-5]|uniref:nucleotide exchange factor GrpE n=1 Tax=unclassified Ereboglobus TaxID=2626932 RepID=UPI0024051C41|nr:MULTISPECIES: nucleotide exchange factor GrpE [unclassified Ereboglobus]MDF9828022.1 molecular chaperone GrpE [Ereboglobus sp. PH5-10]MDF9832284.1 molecular chaperone GrpE [Ereboglobus sp. PH5-5]